MTLGGDENGLYRQAGVPCSNRLPALEETGGFTTHPEMARARTGDQAMLACLDESEDAGRQPLALTRSSSR